MNEQPKHHNARCTNVKVELVPVEMYNLALKYTNPLGIDHGITKIRAIANMTESEVIDCLLHQIMAFGYSWSDAVTLTRNAILMGLEWNTETHIWTDPNYNEKTPE